MTSLFFDHTDIWIVADLETDPVAWSRGLVQRRAEEEGLQLERERIELLADVMLPALERSRAEDPPPVMVLFLYPLVSQPIVTSVKVRAESIEDGVTLDEIADEIKFPAEMLEQPALVETVDTRSGPALHMIQRYREPVNPEVEQVREHEAYVWILADYDGPMLVTLSTTYLDLVAAGEWRPELAGLASTLVMKQDLDGTAETAG
jgi:hypothetical protein